MDENEKNKEIIRVIKFLEENLRFIPGCNGFIDRLKKRNNQNDLIQALIIERYYIGGKFHITKIEHKPSVNKDVDIELNNLYNIQVWHGSTDIIHKAFRNESYRTRGINVNHEVNKRYILKKLNQLPDDNIGLVLIYHYFGFGFDFDYYINQFDIPKNKAIVIIKRVENNIGISESADIYISNNSKIEQIIKDIISGANFRISNTFRVNPEEE